MAQYLVTAPGPVNVHRKRSTLHDHQESCNVVDPALRGSNFHSRCTARRCWSGASLGALGSAIRRANKDGGGNFPRWRPPSSACFVRLRSVAEG